MASRVKKDRARHEQDRPDILRRRRAWFEVDLDPERLVFIDETWAKSNMVRTHGRCLRGKRLRFPHGHWKTTTFVAGLTLRGMIAPFVLSGPTNRRWLRDLCREGARSELRPGDIVVMHNLSGQRVREHASSWTTPERRCSSSRPMAPTSIRSRTPSPS